MSEPRQLNNLVIELVSPGSLPNKGYQEVSFQNPYDGWVFFSVTAKMGSKGSVTASLDSSKKNEAILAARSESSGKAVEAMRFLPKGSHKLNVWCDAGARVSGLIIRAIPELIYCQYPVNPHIAQHGSYDWNFLSKYVFPNANSMTAGGTIIDYHKPYMQEWRNQGKRLLFHAGIPGTFINARDPLEKSFEYWYTHPGYQEPLAGGIIVDEFIFGPVDERYLTWSDAIMRIYKDPKMKDKVFFAWTAGKPMYEGPDGTAFTHTLMKHGGKVAVEYYISERPTIEGADRSFDTIKSDVGGWKNLRPDANRYIIATLGYMSQPNESLNTDPTIDFKVFMDRMMWTMANDPELKDLYGLIWYLSPYTDEENIRWGSRLFRHYAIEGKKNMLSEEFGYKYNLDHVANPDFVDGTNGWTLSPAEEGSVTTGSLEGWSWLQGRYPKTKMGDTFLLTTRSEKGPNKFSQKIVNLKPGQLYSLKMMTGDYKHITEGISNRYTPAVSINIDNVEFIPERCFDQLIDNCYSHGLGKFDNVHKAWFNYHWRVFRANGTTADLTVSDWRSPREVGGDPGQQTMFNFIEVQPFYLE